MDHNEYEIMHSCFLTRGQMYTIVSVKCSQSDMKVNVQIGNKIHTVCVPVDLPFTCCGQKALEYLETNLAIGVKFYLCYYGNDENGEDDFEIYLSPACMY